MKARNFRHRRAQATAHSRKQISLHRYFGRLKARAVAAAADSIIDDLMAGRLNEPVWTRAFAGMVR